MESIISNTSESLRISLDKIYVELCSMQMMSVVNFACKQPIDVYFHKCPKCLPLSLGEVSPALHLLIFAQL